MAGRCTEFASHAAAASKSAEEQCMQDSMNGQTAVNNRLHPQLIEHLVGLKRFRPPTQNGCSIAEWYRGVGPGHRCSVYFKEDGP